MEIFSSIWMMFTESAPWLLVGFLIAGFLHELLSGNFVEKHLKGNSWRSVVNSSLVGIPLPLCSCSVIPVAVSLRRKGASKGATASFLVSTPEIGVDSFLLSYGLLGPLITLARVIAAFCSAMLAGLGITFLEPSSKELENQESIPSSSDCCSSKKEPSCCSMSQPESLVARAFRYSFINLIDDLAFALLFGLVLAGIISALIPPELIASLNVHPVLMMIIMFFVAAPFYVCATSSTPLAAALLLKGFPPGAILVFLLAGPATNITTMLAVLKELGARSLAIYLFSVFSISLIAASIVDQISIAGELGNMLRHFGHDHSQAPLYAHLAGIALLVLLLQSVARKEIKKRRASVKDVPTTSCCSEA